MNAIGISLGRYVAFVMQELRIASKGLLYEIT